MSLTSFSRKAVSFVGAVLATVLNNIAADSLVKAEQLMTYIKTTHVPWHDWRFLKPLAVFIIAGQLFYELSLVIVADDTSTNWFVDSFNNMGVVDSLTISALLLHSALFCCLLLYKFLHFGYVTAIIVLILAILFNLCMSVYRHAQLVCQQPELQTNKAFTNVTPFSSSEHTLPLLVLFRFGLLAGAGSETVLCMNPESTTEIFKLLASKFGQYRKTMKAPSTGTYKTLNLLGDTHAYLNDMQPAGKLLFATAEGLTPVERENLEEARKAVLECENVLEKRTEGTALAPLFSRKFQLHHHSLFFERPHMMYSMADERLTISLPIQNVPGCPDLGQLPPGIQSPSQVKSFLKGPGFVKDVRWLHAKSNIGDSFAAIDGQQAASKTNRKLVLITATWVNAKGCHQAVVIRFTQPASRFEAENQFALSCIGRDGRNILRKGVPFQSLEYITNQDVTQTDQLERVVCLGEQRQQLSVDDRIQRSQQLITGFMRQVRLSQDSGETAVPTLLDKFKVRSNEYSISALMDQKAERQNSMRRLGDSMREFSKGRKSLHKSSITKCHHF